MSKKQEKNIDLQDKKVSKKIINKKEKEIIQEKERLIKYLKNKNIDSDKLNIAIELINDIAFMTIETKDLKDQVQYFGTTEEYQNGANQKGRKKSACFEAYLNMTKQKAALIKQLTELLPEDEQGNYKIPINDNGEEEKDEFDTFLSYREAKNESNN